MQANESTLVHESSTKFLLALAKHRGLSILCFYSNTCAACKASSVPLASMIKDNTDVCFMHVDVDANEEVLQYFKILQVPSFVFVRGLTKERRPRVLDTVIGFDERAIKMKIMQHA